MTRALRRVAGAKDADQAMDIIVQAQGRVWGGEVGNEDCHLIIAAAIDRGNVELALSVFHAMRSGSEQGLSEKISSVERWSWARPDVRTCAQHRGEFRMRSGSLPMFLKWESLLGRRCHLG